jgi:hypothetical protein
MNFVAIKMGRPRGGPGGRPRGEIDAISVTGDWMANSFNFAATGTCFPWFNRRCAHFCIDLSDGNDNLDARLQDCISATVPGASIWVFNFPPLS